MKKAILFIFLNSFSYHCFSQVWNNVGSAQIPNWNNYSLFVWKNELYAGGGLYAPGWINYSALSKWNGTTWDSTGFTAPWPYAGLVYSMQSYNNELIVGGNFRRADTVSNTQAIARWDGIQWASVGGGFLPGSTVYILQFKDYLYVGGGFNTMQSLNDLNCMARWDGNSWNKVGTGVIGDFSQVRAMAVFNNELYLGGYFIKAGGKAAYNIAGWDGIQYFDLDTGVAGDVNALTVDSINNLLYVGGEIYHVGGNNGFYVPNGVVKWDGYLWDTIGLNPKFNKGATSLAMYNNQLYAGTYDGTGNIWDTILTRFDGQQWYRIEGPISTILCLEVYNNELYTAGGWFMTSAGDTAEGIARYYAPPDTTSCLFIQPLIHAMLFGTKAPRDTFYTTPPYNIQFYTNNKYASSWSWNFEDGNTANTREPTHTYAAPGTYNVTLEVIHQHNLSSKICTLNVSKTITIIDNTAIKEIKPQEVEYLGQNIPNPFTNTTIIPYFVPVGSKGFLQITDTQGELIDEYALQQGKNKLEISMASYKAGVYYYSLVIDGAVKETKKMMIDK